MLQSPLCVNNEPSSFVWRHMDCLQTHVSLYESIWRMSITKQALLVSEDIRSLASED